MSVFSDWRDRRRAAMEADDRFDIFGPDDDLTGLVDSLDEDPHLDPNTHWREVGCRICRDRIVRFRSFIEEGSPTLFVTWEAEISESAR